MTFDDKLDKILLSHGAEQGELHYSLKQAIKDLVLSDIVGEDKPNYFGMTPNELRENQRLTINGKESNDE